ncbi:MAG: hypothetical protein ACP5O3_01960 [Candidatus Micrarchaeia archaeon]
MNKTSYCVFFYALLLLASTAAAIDLGTCGGYIKYANGSIAPGATVVVQVNDCTGSPNCQKTTTSQANGYYVVANLKIDSAGTIVTVTANQSNYQGSNTGTANSEYAAFVNVTLCRAPSQPTLTLVPDSHVPSATMSWAGGIDPDGNPTYDQFQLDSNQVLNNSFPPQTASGLTYSTHSWRVRTCNAGCCSNWATDSFTITNAQPTTPQLTVQGNTANNTVTLHWTSGTDADGDSVYDEFQLDSNPVISPATSPRVESTLSFGWHTWRVRTCDNTTASNSCSAWNSSSFQVINNPPSPPQLAVQGNTHSTSVLLSWASGTDPDGHTTHDEFQLDSNPVISPATSPQTTSGLSFSTHSWKVRTCDSFGACSAWNSSAFTVFNNPPTVPAITLIPDGNYSNVTLQWTSGIDPDGDPTYDQLDFHSAFQPSNVTNETSPATRTNTSGAFQWQVRTCDSYGYCSAWNASYFLSSSCPPCLPCQTVSAATVGGGGVWFMCAATALSMMTVIPSIVLDGSQFTIPITIRNPDLDMPLTKVHVDFDASSSGLGSTQQLKIDSAYIDWLGPGQETTVYARGTALLAEKNEAGLIEKTFPITLTVTEGALKKQIYRQDFNLTVATLGTLAVLPTAVKPEDCIKAQQLAIEECRKTAEQCRQATERAAQPPLPPTEQFLLVLPGLTPQQSGLALAAAILVLLLIIAAANILTQLKQLRMRK